MHAKVVFEVFFGSGDSCCSFFHDAIFISLNRYDTDKGMASINEKDAVGKQKMSRFDVNR